MKNLNSFIYTVATALILSSCAQVVSPTGGEKDIIPPKLLWAVPELQSTKVNSRTIEIQFDEYIQFRDFKDQFMVSPPLPTAPEVEIRGKTLLIEIEDSLKKNTTYLFNFGNSIVDINENNALENFQYVFSTGSEIDSLQVKGILADAYSLKTEQGILVMLYDELYDSIPYLSLPSYASRTDENGNFKLSNIKAGKYKLFALDDKNNNYLYDRPDERIAFLDSPVNISSTGPDSIKLFLFQEKDPKRYIKERKIINNHLLLLFNSPTDSFYLKAIDNQKLPPHFIQTNENKDSIRIWWRNLNADLDLRTIAVDADYLQDTLKIKIPRLQNDSSVGLEKALPNVQNFHAPLALEFEKPINKVDKSKIQLYLQDSIAVDFKIKHNELSRTVEIISKWEENSNYRLLLLPKAVTDIHSRINDSIQKNFQSNSSKIFSSLKLNIQTADKKGLKLIQLLDQNGKVLKEKLVDSEIIYFKYLQSGNYRIKLIFDANRNKKWDTGNYLNKQSPEKAVLFDGIINLRPNWEKEIIWELK